MRHSTYARFLLLASALLLALYLLLLQDGIAFSSRMMHALWNRAHVLLFFSLTLVFDRSLLHRGPRQPLLWCLMLWLPLLMFAIVTEALQALTARQPSIDDVLWNCVGILIGTAWLTTRRYALSPHVRRSHYLLIMLILLITFYKPMELLFSDYQSQRDFPLISNAERITDKNLWSRGEASDEYAQEGRYAWRVKLAHQLFTGVSLRHFPADWLGYKSLHFSVYNPQKETLKLALRIDDRAHELGEQAHQDRFNMDLDAKPGWNKWNIALSKIEKAPRTRQLNLTQISHIRFYARDEQQTGRTFFIDDVYLQP